MVTVTFRIVAPAGMVYAPEAVQEWVGRAHQFGNVGSAIITAATVDEEGNALLTMDVSDELASRINRGTIIDLEEP